MKEKNRVAAAACFFAFFAAFAGALPGEAGPLKPISLSDLTANCPAEIKTEFYKSLFFVDGRLASMNAESVWKCIASGSGEALGERFGESLDSKFWEREGYNCKCNEHDRLGCKKEKGWICEPFDCSGDCDHSEKRRYSLPEKYMGMEEIYARIPEEVAGGFVGGLVLDKGRVKKISISRELTKYLAGEETKQIISILMSRDWAVIKKIKALSNYMGELRGKSAKFTDADAGSALAEKYDELFGGVKLKFDKYDDETLEKFWNVYKALFSGVKDKKYFSKAKSVFMSFRKRNVYGRQGKDEFGVFAKEFFSLCLSAGELPLAREMKREYPDILKSETVPAGR